MAEQPPRRERKEAPGPKIGPRVPEDFPPDVNVIEGEEGEGKKAEGQRGYETEQVTEGEAGRESIE